MADDLYAGYKLKIYLRTVTLTTEVVSIRSGAYRPGAFNPSGEGRFHRAGDPTYYAGSGIDIAKAEKYGDPARPIDPGDRVYEFQCGEAQLFDVASFVRDHPECSGILALSGPDKWHMGQALRTSLESVDCSGAFAPSTKLPRGVNVIVWPLSKNPLPDGYFTLRPSSGTDPVVPSSAGTTP